MDQRTGHAQQHIDERQAAVTEKVGRVEERVQETVEGAKAAVDEVLESVKGTVNETVERMKPAADLLDYVQQNPWLLLGGAIMMGYILGSLAREKASISHLTKSD